MKNYISELVRHIQQSSETNDDFCILWIVIQLSPFSPEFVGLHMLQEEYSLLLLFNLKLQQILYFYLKRFLLRGNYPSKKESVNSRTARLRIHFRLVFVLQAHNIRFYEDRIIRKRAKDGMADNLPVSVPIVAPRTANAVMIGEYMSTAR